MTAADLRGFAQALALGGMIFYAVLVPWHTVSQATSGIVSLMVHASLPPGGSEAKRSLEAIHSFRPRTKCPICNGFGTLHLAAGVPANFVVYRASENEELPTTYVQAVAKTDRRAPQNRGPPALSA